MEHVLRICHAKTISGQASEERSLDLSQIKHCIHYENFYQVHYFMGRGSGHVHILRTATDQAD